MEEEVRKQVLFCFALFFFKGKEGRKETTVCIEDRMVTQPSDPSVTAMLQYIYFSSRVSKTYLCYVDPDLQISCHPIHI